MTDKKAQMGIDFGVILTLIITVGIIGVVGVVFILIYANLGSNELIADDVNAGEIINASTDAIKSPFSLFPLAITIVVFIVILSIVMLLRRLQE